MSIRNQFRFCYAIVLVGIAFLPSCKKEASTPPTSTSLPLSTTEQDPRVGNSTFVALSPDSYEVLQSIMGKGQIKDTIAFDSVVRSLLSVEAATRPTVVLDDPSGSNVAGTDDLNGATTGQEDATSLGESPELQQLVDSWWEGIPEDYVDEYNEANEGSSYPCSISNIQSFPIRGNTVDILLNFSYGVTVSTSGSFVLAGISPGSPAVQILPVGANWGTVTQISSSMNGNGSALGAFAHAQEERTQIWSQNLTFKISTNINVEAFQIGGEMGAGFTIQKVNNIYNQYDLTAQLSIYATGGPGNISGYLPKIAWFGSILCVDNGILLNN